ncbi:MAG: hypothetical protein ACP5UR_04205, partial [Chloroflexus sp.]
MYLQTSSPSRGLGIGDWYTNNSTGAGNGYHYITLHVPCGWDPNNPVHIDLFHPDLNNTSGGGVSDEITTSGTTTFEVYQPGTVLNPPTQPGPLATGSLIQQTYNSNTIGPQWTRLYTIPAPVTCGTYILRAQTGGNADNSWRLRFGTDNDNDPNNSPPLNYDNPDGNPGTGDELLIGISATTFQHDNASGACITLYEYVNPGQSSVTFHNFDMDGNIRVRYYAPSDTYDPNGLTGGITGTISSNAVWNGGTGSTRGGNAFANPESGWWRIVTCVNPNNQFIQEGQTGVIGFLTQPPTPRMELSKTDGTTLTAPGQTLTYTLTFTNTSHTTPSPGAAFNVVITDTLPTGVSYQSCSMGSLAGSCSESGGVVTFTLTNPVVAGSSGTVSVTVQVDPGAGGSITNTATLSYTDQLNNPYPSVSTSDTDNIPPQPQMVLSKTDGMSITAPGQTLTYTLTFTNTGVGAAHNVVISDTLPTGVSFQSCDAGSLGSCSASGGVVTFTLTNPLTSGASGSVTVTGLVTASGPVTLTNTATLTYTDSANQPRPSVTASDETTVPPQPQMVLSKTDGMSITAPGQTLTYTLTFTNTGVGAAHNVVISDTLPTGVSFQSCDAGSLGSCSASGGVVTFTLTNPLTSGASGSVTVTGLVTASGPVTLTNTATLTYTDSANQPRPSVTASDETTVPPQPQMVLSKTDGMSITA